MTKIAVQVEHVSKEYRLGAIGGGTLRGDIQSYFARLRGQENPNTLIGQEVSHNEKFLALKDITFSVNKGERLGIIGHNGAGKSTLLKLLSRVTAPSQGTIGMNGRVASMLEVGTGFHPELTGRENVYMNGAILGMSKAEISRKFDEIVSFAEMEKFIDTPVKRYSSGMYVKLAFAVAAHLDSEIMVMDEVLAVGDMKFQQKCLGKMGDVSKDEGRTVLYVSHNMNTIRQLCDRCIVLDHGKLIYDGNVEKAIEIYSNVETHDLSNQVNLTNVKRADNMQGTKVRMTHFAFENEHGCNLCRGEKIRFSLTLKSEIIKDDVCFRVMLYFSDDNPICMGGIKKGELSLKEGENKIQGVIDTSRLAPGKYYMKIAMYQVNEFGTEQLLDVVNRAVSFAVDDSDVLNRMSWLHQYWGHMSTDVEITQ